VSNLSAIIGEEAETIEEVIEPYLIKEGFIKRTPKGRVAMSRAWERLGLKPPPGPSEQLELL
jgi:Holliday junction DNA helicase RuvB